MRMIKRCPKSHCATPLKFRTASSFLILAVMAPVWLLSNCRAGNIKPPRQEIMAQYLRESGNQLNCYFTIEEAKVHAGQIHSSYSQKYIAGTKVRTLNELIEKLKNDLPDTLVVRDSSDPKIIHIISKETKSTPEYPLDHRLTLSYNGDLPGLASAIGRKMNGAVGPRGSFTTVDMEMDYITAVDVNVRDKPIREILSAGIPLAGYSRVLWKACPFDAQEDGSVAMYIQFYGPAPKPYKPEAPRVDKPKTLSSP